MRVLLCSLLLLTAVGCVERKLFIRTEPAGASIEVNGRPVGDSPAGWAFDHFGVVRVGALLPGYEAHAQDVKLKIPWYQRPVIDFFAELIWPWTIRHHQYVDIVLKPIPDRTREENEALAREVGERAVELRDKEKKTP